MTGYSNARIKRILVLSLCLAIGCVWAEIHSHKSPNAGRDGRGVSSWGDLVKKFKETGSKMMNWSKEAWNCLFNGPEKCPNWPTRMRELFTKALHAIDKSVWQKFKVATYCVAQGSKCQDSSRYAPFLESLINGAGSVTNTTILKLTYEAAKKWGQFWIDWTDKKYKCVLK